MARKKKPKSLCQTCPYKYQCKDPCNPSDCEFHPIHPNADPNITQQQFLESGIPTGNKVLQTFLAKLELNE